MPMCPLTRDEWRKQKDKYDAPSGLIKEDMGKLFQKYGDARRKSKSQQVLIQMQDAVKEHNALYDALKKYRAAIKKKKDAKLEKFGKECIDAWTKELDGLADQAAKFANPVAKFSEALKNLETKIKPVAADPDPVKFKSFWSGAIRNLGTCMDGLAKMEPGCAKLHKLWQPLTKNDFGSPKDAKETVSRLKVVAASLKTTKAEAKKMNLIA